MIHDTIRYCNALYFVIAHINILPYMESSLMYYPIIYCNVLLFSILQCIYYIVKYHIAM